MRFILLLLFFLVAGCETTKHSSGSDVKYPSMSMAKKSFKKAKAIKYKSDDPEFWQLPSETEKLKTGDCEDKAFYLHYLLMNQGFVSKVVIGYTLSDSPIKDYSEKNDLHAWNEVEIDGVPYILDSTSGLFEKKSQLRYYYQWNITHSDKVLKDYDSFIRYYISRSRYDRLEKFAKSLEIGFALKEKYSVNN